MKRPSREESHWGMDMIEAVTHGKAIIAVGSYDGFAKHGINGYLHKDSDPTEIAEGILFPAHHPEEVERMGMANR
jgi:hypothetical protein